MTMVIDKIEEFFIQNSDTMIDVKIEIEYN